VFDLVGMAGAQSAEHIHLYHVPNDSANLAGAHPRHHLLHGCKGEPAGVWLMGSFAKVGAGLNAVADLLEHDCRIDAAKNSNEMRA
jgi:hypothetical protein